jgi:hypothetical protein
MGAREARHPVQIRLPGWAVDYITNRAGEGNTTRSHVMIEALQCLQRHDLEQLMEQGYREMAALNETLAEENLAAGAETWPPQ